MTLEPQQVFKIMTGNTPWCGIDVRSEGEFLEGHWSGLKNTPILNNEHRHLVGTAYKQQGQDEAVKLGFELIDKEKQNMIQSWRNDLQKAPEENRFVTCWRGGMRSKFAQQWINESGLKIPRVNGGVKALRRYSLDLLSRGPEKILLIGGMTGNGKTDLLKELPQQQVIDLEALANHRGSSFGGWLKDPQPAQTTFENNLAIEIFKKQKFAIMEAESRLVGMCVIPDDIKKKMDTAEMIMLDSPMEERVDRLLKEYVTDPFAKHGEEIVMENLKKNLLKIQRKLGGLQTQVTLQKMEAREHRAWIEDLLVHYYDKLYAHSTNIKKRTIIFRGNRQEVLGFLTS